MYKETIISIIIVIAIFICNNISQNYTENTVDNINIKLYSLKKEINNLLENSKKNNNKEINNTLKEVKNEWEDKYHILAIYLEHDELEKVQKELMLLNGNIEANEYKDAVLSIDSCIFSLDHLKENEILNVDNFF